MSGVAVENASRNDKKLERRLIPSMNGDGDLFSSYIRNVNSCCPDGGPSVEDERRMIGRIGCLRCEMDSILVSYPFTKDIYLKARRDVRQGEIDISDVVTGRDFPFGSAESAERERQFFAFCRALQYVNRESQGHRALSCLEDAYFTKRFQSIVVHALRGYLGSINDKSLLGRIDRIEFSLREAEHDLIKSNLKFVIAIANRYKQFNPRLSLLDLVQEGNIGLMKAVSYLDPCSENRFASYSYWWIRQQILQGIRQKGHSLRLPDHVHGIIRRINKFMHMNPGLKDDDYWRRVRRIAEGTFLSESAVTNAFAAQSMLNLLSLEMVIYREDGSQELKDFVADPAAENPEHECSRRMLLEKLRGLVESLDDGAKRTKNAGYVLKMRLAGETLDSIGVKMGTTRQRVEQIEKTAYERLKLRLLNALKSKCSPDEEGIVDEVFSVLAG